MVLQHGRQEFKVSDMDDWVDSEDQLDSDSDDDEKKKKKDSDDEVRHFFFFTFCDFDVEFNYFLCQCKKTSGEKPLACTAPSSIDNCLKRCLYYKHHK